MKQFGHFTLEELTAHPISKGELITLIGFTGNLLKQGIWFDYALPQEWVDSFLTHCKKAQHIIENKGVITYDLIISSTVWVYIQGDPIGYAVSGCSEVQWAIEAFQKEQN